MPGEPSEPRGSARGDLLAHQARGHGVAVRGEEPARDIMKIVNAHHQSLAYLNAKAQKMDADVSALEADVEQLRRQAPP